MNKDLLEKLTDNVRVIEFEVNSIRNNVKNTKFEYLVNDLEVFKNIINRINNNIKLELQEILYEDYMKQKR